MRQKNQPYYKILRPKDSLKVYVLAHTPKATLYGCGNYKMAIFPFGEWAQKKLIKFRRYARNQTRHRR